MTPKTEGSFSHASDSTVDLLQRARSGDQSAMHILIQRALPAVHRWAQGRLPRHVRAGVDTEDMVQDAVIGTLRRLNRFQHRTVGGLQAYLRQAVLNRIRDLIRRSARRPTLAPDVDEAHDWNPSPLEAAIMQQRADRFLSALRRLRPADRQIIVWRIELGYTAGEIAAKLGKSKAAAGMTITRAITRLATEMSLENQTAR